MKENEFFLYSPRKSMENGRVPHSFLISARDASGWSASGSGHLSPVRKLGGPRCLSCCFGKKTDLLQFPAIKPRSLGYPAHKLLITEHALSLCETINTYSYFTFMWPYIVTNFLYNKTNRYINFPNLFWLKNELLHLMFFRPCILV